MMCGVDAVMPDKIVKRVINEILEKAGLGKEFFYGFDYFVFVRYHGSF